MKSTEHLKCTAEQEYKIAEAEWMPNWLQFEFRT